MGLRTIDAPGVEIKEIDKSGYTPAMTGTKCLVMGYSDKGTPYEPMQFTSKTAWQNYYGDPDNEAERYFYNACSEVINQNGVLNCARLPYDNKAFNKMVGYKFKVSTTPKNIPTANEYIKNTAWATVSHDKDFEKDALNYAFDNLLNREIDGDGSSLEFDSELKDFYSAVIDNFEAKYKSLKDRWSVEYYEANLSDSVKLSARFLKYEEAAEYVKQFEGAGKQGVYDYYTVLSDCIINDLGDWIAQPMKYDFKKVVSSDAGSEYKPQTILEISGDVEQLISKEEYDDDRYIKPMKTVDDIMYNLNILTDKVIKPADIQTITNIITVVGSMKNPDGKTKELTKYTAILLAEALSSTNKISVDGIDVYGSYTGIKDIRIEVGANDLVFKLPKYININPVNDGYDNEPMYYETVSALYNELELYKMPTICALYNGELWIPARGKSLGNLLRDRNLTNDQARKMWDTETAYGVVLSSWEHMLLSFVDNTKITFADVIEKYGPSKDAVHAAVPYYPVTDGDPACGDYLPITGTEAPISYELTAVDAYRTGEEKVPANTFWIFDKTCATMNKISEDTRKGKDRELLGIFPVVTTAVNAMYAQSLIDVDKEFVTDFETVRNAVTKVGNEQGKSNEFVLSTDIVTQFSNDVRTKQQIAMGEVLDTISRDANGYFLPIQMNSQQSGFDTENLKKIGVVVYKAYLDASEGNKISFAPVESFVGSLDKDAKNPNTGVSTFLDKIVNSQSDYIYFFSNCFVNATQKKILNDVDMFIMNPGKTGMLGWFSDETVEEISLTSLYSSIDKVFVKLEDINERDIDIVCDAGLANIAQYMKSIYGGSGTHAYDLEVTDDGGNPLIKNWKVKSAADVNAWKTVLFKYDNFCKNVRKDCMFIADGPRPLVLQGQVKIIRPSKPTNTLDADVLPYIKYITGLNTNYGAGYCDWFQITDEFTGDEFWCPPSIKAMGVYINTDLNFQYWDAPAGLNRGVIQALDCSFSPTIKQAGSIYTKNWNYAINYPNDGIVLEGQKTFQVKPSAFDRVNVRRLFLRLERQTYKVARYFVYEGNTAYTRQRLVDMLTPIFQTAKVGGGVYDYKIICDESINTPNVIDNNELRVKIGIKPTKTAEFILIDFIALATGGSFSEM